MHQALLVMLLLIAIVLVALIMLQQGKGVDMGSSSGTGVSGTLFGSNGSGNFMTRMIAVMATLFFLLSLLLGNLSSQHEKNSQWDTLNQPQKPDQSLAGAPVKAGHDISQ
ncbi:preprotein translocase subunit SecG [Candidatus Steffania adelgidicola]|uniref:preprotein translocase subunit SecG n=1 Tax=Candidatus Steffania adelgidicola TaxID=1076626 RepID=UPI001D01EAAA|nr:preprotein translocase subunit SecG [Candidatus Steffania adelgidicola]UDG79798.1 Protein-export membrane protein SecG [Candidatus Steffania adelgidicola]